MIEVIRADITTLDVEAIVNAANEDLAPSGGVCGAIYRAAGPELQRYTDRLRPCATGNAVLTPGFGLKARYIIHAVGPVWSGGANGEARLLRSAYQSVFDIAREDRMKSIAFPAISTGIYGYPRDEATRIAVHMMRHYEHMFDRIVACVFDDEMEELYEGVLQATPVVPAPEEVTLTKAKFLPPSSFETAMMAKLKIMLPETAYDYLEQNRNGNVVTWFSKPEVQEIWEAIQEDRNKILEQAIYDGSYQRWLKENEP